MDIQQTFLDMVREQLPSGIRLADSLMEDLHISKDAAYRRIRGEVPLTIQESKKLSDKYGISLDEIQSLRKGVVSFEYKSIRSIDFNFDNYIQGIQDGYEFIRRLRDPHLYISVNDTPILQFLNFPRLLNFKFFYWAKSFLKAEEYQSSRFSEKIVSPAVIQKGYAVRDMYNSIPTTEIYSPETIRGMLRQVHYYFEADLFEDDEIALHLLDDLSALCGHLKSQAEEGFKFSFEQGGPGANSGVLQMYFNDTYLPDNTYMVKHADGITTWFTHNIMNYITITDPVYNDDTSFMMQQLIRNSTLISQSSEKVRNKFFAELNRTILSFKARIEAAMNLT